MKESKKRKFNKFDEHYLIPLILCFMTATVVCVVYLVTEYFTSPTKFVKFYQFNPQQVLQYKRQVLLLGGTFAGILALYFLSLKLKNRWFYWLLIMGNVVAFYNLRLVL